MPVAKIFKLVSAVVIAFAAVAWLLSTQGFVTTSELQSRLKEIVVILVPAIALVGLIAIWSRRGSN